MPLAFSITAATSRCRRFINNPHATRQFPIIHKPMIAPMIHPMIAAVGYSLIYILGGGGLFGAFIIFIIAKMLGK